MNKIALIYPGTGSQYSGMFKGFHENYSIVRETFQEAEEALKINLAQLCFEDSLSKSEGIAYAQAAILVCSVAGHRVFMQEVGMKPAYAAGHSLGEWSALTCAGAVSFLDAVKIVWQRGKWMEEATPEGGGLIAAVKQLPAHVVKEQCSKGLEAGSIVEIACYNASDQVVIAGHRQAIEKVSESLETLGGRVVRLNANVPFHTSLMHSASVKLAEAVKSISFNKPEWPVISNVTASPHIDEASMKTNVAEQLTNPVRWEETVRFMQQQGIHSTVEIGPNSVLKKLNKKTARNIKAYALDHSDDMSSILAIRQLRPTFINKCLSIAVSTCNNNKNTEEYRKGVVVPYQRMLQIDDDLNQAGKSNAGEDSVRQLEEAYELLQQILDSKKVPEEEQKIRLQELFFETNTTPFAQH